MILSKIEFCTDVSGSSFYTRRNESGKIVLLIQFGDNEYFAHILCEENNYEEAEFFKSLFKSIVWSNSVLIDMGYKIDDPFLIPEDLIELEGDLT
jgi:hypothetical protein